MYSHVWIAICHSLISFKRPVLLSIMVDAQSTPHDTMFGFSCLNFFPSYFSDNSDCLKKNNKIASLLEILYANNRALLSYTIDPLVCIESFCDFSFSSKLLIQHLAPCYLFRCRQHDYSMILFERLRHPLQNCFENNWSGKSNNFFPQLFDTSQFQLSTEECNSSLQKLIQFSHQIRKWFSIYYQL